MAKVTVRVARMITYLQREVLLKRISFVTNKDYSYNQTILVLIESVKKYRVISE